MTEHRTKLVYFAWVRERIGLVEEEVRLPAGIVSVRDLLGWLQERGDGYAQALRFPDAIRVAIDHQHVQHGERIGGAREIALFPPMTGG
jgi:molybdopterin synthase sulfur carrier subunit